MKEYILYIVVALAIVGVIAVYFITNKKIANLENEIVNLSEGFNKLQNIVNTNRTLETEDPFNQTINNITPNPSGGVTMQPSYGETGKINESSSETLNSQSSSNLRLKNEIAELKKDINNIEDLISDSSADSGQSRADLGNQEFSNKDEYRDINLAEQNTHSNNLSSVIADPINSDLVNEVNQNINRNSMDINYKNNMSEFDDLGNTELENNSEFNSLLDNTEKTIDNIEGKIESLVEDLRSSNSNKIHLSSNQDISLENNDINLADNTNIENDNVLEETIVIESSNVSQESNTQIVENLVEIPTKKLTEVEAQVIADTYTKRELEKICLNNNISKSGTKIKLVYRLNKNGYSFKPDSKTSSNNLSVN